MAAEYGWGIGIFDDGVMRPTVTDPGGNWRTEFDTDSGTLFGYNGQTNFGALQGLVGGNSAPCVATNVAPAYSQGSCITVDDERLIRVSAGGSLIWASPLGPIRMDLAYPIIKGKYDQLMLFNFSGGTTF